MARRVMWLAMALVIILAIVLVSLPSSPVALTPKASTGVFLTGCAYDSDGKVLGCSYSNKSPLGQSILTGFGGSVGSIKIPSAYLKVNYTGQASSWSFSAMELVQYDKGISDSYAISVSGSGNPQKTMNLTLPKSSWTSSELQGKFSGYGQKLVNTSVTNCSWTFTFINSIKIVKPCAYDYFVQFRLDYGQSVTTSTTSTMVSATTTTSSTTMTQTTSSTTAISGEGVSSGTTDVWTTTITSASGGATGNTASNGIIATLAPDYYFPSSQSVVWVYYSVTAYSQCSQGIFVSVVTPSTSVTVGRLPVFSNTWSGGISVPTAVTSGNPYLLQVLCANSALTLVFNQVVTASPAQTNAAYGANLPPPPYDAQYIATLAPPTPITTTITSATYSTWIDTDGATNIACYSGGVQLASPKPCYPPLSIISVTF